MTKIAGLKIWIVIACFVLIFSIFAVIVNAMAKEYIAALLWLMGCGICLFSINGSLGDIWQIKRKELLDELLSNGPNPEGSDTTKDAQ